MSTTRYTILGNVPDFREYDAGSSEFTFTASALSLAVDVMNTHECMEGMTDLAMSWDQWANRGSLFASNRARAKALAAAFVEHIKRQTPLILLDGDMTGHTVLGLHPRGSWEGAHAHFNPRNQFIKLNSTMITDMIKAAAHDDRKAFEMFQFKVATTLLHECAGHLFITFLGHGDIGTPNQTNVLGWGAEAGRYLEFLLFGGTMGWYDDGSGIHQPGHPYLLLRKGGIDKVQPTVIERFVNRDFYFPLPTDGRPTDPTRLTQLGASERVVVSQSSSDRRMLARVERYRLDGFPVANKDLRKVPQNSRLRLQAVR